MIARTAAALACALFAANTVASYDSAQETGAGRPAILGIAHISIRVSSLPAAKRFYGGLLGYDELPSRSGSVAIFRINDRQRLVIHEGLPPDQDERLLHIAFETDDAAAMRTYLSSHRLAPGEVAADPHGAGRCVDVADPDGHRVRFIQRDDAAPSQNSPTDRRISRRILHGGYTVKDAAAADRFYKDVLGFSEIWRGGRTDDVTSWINMRVPDGTDYLEYMLTTGPATRQQLGSAHHVALLVPDIQAALETARARSDQRNARATPQVGRNRRWQLNLFDPDGTRVEFMEPWPIR
jgi:catechol 2,3-dioxygenase-like lactoylglutathione lyase family enzyme